MNELRAEELAINALELEIEAGMKNSLLSSSAAEAAYTSTAVSSTPTLDSGLFCQHCGAISMSLRGRTAAQQQFPFAMHTNKSPSIPACA